MLKSIKAPQLADAVRKTAAGEATLDSHVATRVMQELHGSRLDEINPLMTLTERETEVLQRVANGMNNAEIVEELVITIKTVRSHMSNILSKLHLQDRTQVAVYASQQGIVRRDDKL